MIYTKRRMMRQRMMRRSVITRQFKDAALIIKDFVPEVIAAIAFMFVVFCVLPVLYTAIAYSFTTGVLP